MKASSFGSVQLIPRVPGLAFTLIKNACSSPGSGWELPRATAKWARKGEPVTWAPAGANYRIRRPWGRPLACRGRIASTGPGNTGSLTLTHRITGHSLGLVGSGLLRSIGAKEYSKKRPPEMNLSWGSWAPIHRKQNPTRKIKDTEKLRLKERTRRLRLLTSPKMKTHKIEENRIMNPVILLGTAFRIA